MLVHDLSNSRILQFKTSRRQRWNSNGWSTNENRPYTLLINPMASATAVGPLDDIPIQFGEGNK